MFSVENQTFFVAKAVFFDVRETILVRRDGINEILHYRGQLIIDFVLHYIYRRRVQLTNSI